MFADGRQDRFNGLAVSWPGKRLNVHPNNTEATDPKNLDDLVNKVKRLIE